ncbi:hypothetical protein GOL96_29775 [Sinorhizobium medicae]|nr:hypothetical protein [Sinorhizobium medicae]MDX1237929.1 hypothetical protein [Sinorhizobium medicae]
MIFLTISPTAFAAPGEICYDVAVAINHPAQVVSEKIQKCVTSVLDFVTPHCCLPSWPAHLECYAIKNRTIGEAWTELQTRTQCDPVDLVTGFNQYIKAYFDPKSYFIKSIGSFAAVLKSGVDTVFTVATPLPDDVQSSLRSYIGGGAITRFGVDIVDRARWVSSENEWAKLYHPRTWGLSQDSITYGDLIIAGPALRSAVGCERLAKWAHELTHVQQYKEKGFEGFTTNYLSEFAQGVPYEELSAEIDAKSVEPVIAKACKDAFYTRRSAELAAERPLEQDGSGTRITLTGSALWERQKISYCWSRQIEPAQCDASWSQEFSRNFQTIFQPKWTPDPGDPPRPVYSEETFRDATQLFDFIANDSGAVIKNGDVLQPAITEQLMNTVREQAN